MRNNERMKRFIIILMILDSAIFSFSQSATLKPDKNKTNRFVIWLIPSAATNIYGIAIGLVNHAAVVKGIQIGLINKTKKLRGFQFGLWNKNEKRSLPILNWNFKDKKPGYNE